MSDPRTDTSAASPAAPTPPTGDEPASADGQNGATRTPVGRPALPEGQDRARRLAPAFWLWLSLFLPAATIYHPNAGWNVNSRLDLVFALVDQGSARIDDYQDLAPYDTGDKAAFNGHFYSDKVFGLSLLGVVPYAVLKAAFAVVGKEPGYPISHWWIRIWAVGALAAGAGVLLWRFLRRLGVRPRSAFWLVQVIFYGTLLFPYTTVFYPYLPGVFFCLLAWDRLEGRLPAASDQPTAPTTPRRAPAPSLRATPRAPDSPEPTDQSDASDASDRSDLSDLPDPSDRFVRLTPGVPSSPRWEILSAFLIGLSLGAAMIMDFIFGLAVAAVAARALWKWRGRSWARKTAAAALGGAIPLGAFALYTVSLFGSLSIPYRFEADPLFRIGMSRGFMGITGFQPAVLYYLTVHPYRGLFFWSPLLALAVVGAVQMVIGFGRGSTATPSDDSPNSPPADPFATSSSTHPAPPSDLGDSSDASDPSDLSERTDRSDSPDPAGPSDQPAPPTFRLAGILALGLGVAYLIFNSSYYMWWGGWAMGPRLLIPAIPFLALGAAGVWQWGKWGRMALAVAGIVSVALILPPALVDPQTPMWLHKWPELLHPTVGQNLAVEQFIQLRLFSLGRIDVTLGGLLGLPGLAALIPTGLFWILPVVLSARTAPPANPTEPASQV